MTASSKEDKVTFFKYKAKDAKRNRPVKGIVAIAHEAGSDPGRHLNERLTEMGYQVMTYKRLNWLELWLLKHSRNFPRVD